MKDAFGGRSRFWIIGFTEHKEGNSIPFDFDRAFTSPEAMTLPRGEEETSFDKHEFFFDLRDDRGRPRLDCARNYFLPHLRQQDVPWLVEGFKAWRDYAEYLLIKGVNRVNGKKMFLAVKCSKRGNDVFANRLDRKLGFLRRLKGIEFFHPDDFTPKRLVKTNLLWVTLTYNSRLKTLDEAWKTVMDDYNLWITNLRNEYGKIDVLRFIEAFPDEKGTAFGYPHLHIVLLFKEAQFEVFPRMEEGKDGRLGMVYRIREKYEIERQGKWHSFIDVKALSSGKAVYNYVRKYCSKTHHGDSQGAMVTQSLLWLFRKQTYSLSSGFRSELHDLIMDLQGSKTCEAQKTLDGKLLEDWVWTFHGIRDWLEIGCEPKVWVSSLEEEKFNNLVS